MGDAAAPLKVAALDLGIKKNILRNLASRGVYVKVFPLDTTFETMSEWNPDGYFLSNGPGDPEPLHDAQAIAAEIIAKGLPLLAFVWDIKLLRFLKVFQPIKCATDTVALTTLS